MNIIVVASRKGGAGKSTLTAHLAAHAHKPNRPCLLVDADPQGSLTLWHRLRGTGEPPIRQALRGFDGILNAAREAETSYVFIDTPPNLSALVCEAIRAATLVVIPTRAAVFDLNAVRETIDFARARRKPYAVVINDAPAKRESESPIVTEAREGLARLRVPVWGGQITNRTSFSLALADGEGVREYDAESRAAGEIARLWTAIEKSINAIHGAKNGATMHKVAA